MASASRIEGIAGGGRGPSGGVSKSANKPKITAEARGFSKTKSGRKEMKQQDSFYNQLGKSQLKSGKSTGVAKANTSKSNSKALTPKVPVKKK
jgi:hypothetical protein